MCVCRMRQLAQLHSSSWRYINVHGKLAGACLSADSLQNTPAAKTWPKTLGSSGCLRFCQTQMMDVQVMKQINRLPPELLERIFLMLSYKDRKTAVLVCRCAHILLVCCDFDEYVNVQRPILMQMVINLKVVGGGGSDAKALELGPVQGKCLDTVATKECAKNSKQTANQYKQLFKNCQTNHQ